MKFNLNDYMKVKLTEAGRDILRAKHKQLAEAYPKDESFQQPLVIKEDEDGWYKDQAWYIIQTLGEYIGASADMPFDIVVELEDN